MNSEKTMEEKVRKLFERYERFFRQSLGGDINGQEMAALYTSDFIAATPAGVMTGKNDDEFRQVMAQGYAHYREIGMKEMRIRHVRFHPMDEHHGVAHVAWTAVYARKGQPCSPQHRKVLWCMLGPSKRARTSTWDKRHHARDCGVNGLFCASIPHPHSAKRTGEADTGLVDNATDV